MKIAFWNTGGMGRDSDKLSIADQWVRNNDPDILLFEEISASLEAAVSICGLNKVLWVATLDKNGGRSTKDLAVFAKSDVNLTASDSEMPYIDTVNDDRERSGLFVGEPRRKLCDVCFNYRKENYYLMGLHANSSYSGGATAVACMNKYIEENVKCKIIAGGDFNSDRDGIGKLTKKVNPIDYRGREMTFTQWNKGIRPQIFNKASMDYNDKAYKDYCNELSISEDNNELRTWTKYVLAHKLIDYVLCSAHIDIQPVNNCANETEWLAILKTFDHAPVMFEI
jgi:exonuclease III